MIDTIKIVSNITRDTYSKIFNCSIVKTSYSLKTGKVYYTIINDSLNGSYSSSISVRVGEGIKYRFTNGYYLEIEGSLHKVLLGQNAVCGFYNFSEISLYFIKLVCNAYDISLPSLKHWFVQRVDIAICYDLKNNENVCKYINSLRFCNFRRRKVKYYTNECLYLTGTTTTLKIYNKLLEFKKHDLKNIVSASGFNIMNFLSIIDGFVRFEVEIKKKKLEKLYNNRYIRVVNVSYEKLKEVWNLEFMNLLKFVENNIKTVNTRDQVYQRLSEVYDSNKSNLLFNFYLSIMAEGIDNVKSRTPKSTYYRNLKFLKDLSIDISQTYDIDTEYTFFFNPFEAEEIT